MTEDVADVVNVTVIIITLVSLRKVGLAKDVAKIIIDSQPSAGMVACISHRLDKHHGPIEMFGLYLRRMFIPPCTTNATLVLPKCSNSALYGV